MEIEPADGATTPGLHQLVATLSRQLRVTRQQVLSLQDLKQKKENLLQAGYKVLHQHCLAASLGPDAELLQIENQFNNFQATVTGSWPCSSGWKVSIQVQGSADLLKKINITIASVLPGVGIGGCSVKQLEETSIITTVATDPVVRASALVELQGFPLNSANGTTLEIYALLTPSSASLQPGILSAVVHAGQITLDSTAWLHSFRSLDNNQETKQEKTAWPYAAHFFVKMHTSMQEFDRSWIHTVLVQHLGCYPSYASSETAGGVSRWHFGTAAQVQSQQVEISTTRSDIVPISIYAESLQIVWTIQDQLKTQLENRIKGAIDGALPIWIQTPCSFKNETRKHRGTSINTLKSSVDALISELETLKTWIETLKKQHAAGNSMLVRQEVLVAQAAAVDAMIHTDTTALAVARTRTSS
ncbi:hypothetical protein Ndes2526B_g05738 [Nannochloris sp. 'desiccata']|nr:hypothetical protein KSW81_007569 [Chlorella desiccata (nom. nud.)]KAH7618806.1 hypothetical protein NADE_005655 [Chlorella desiccata (nom. nud.)]